MSEDESLPTIAQKPAAAPARSGSPRLAQGAPPKQCPNCMTLNAATFKFCARCGTPLGATGAPPSGPPAAKAPAAPAKASPPAKPAPLAKAPPPPPAATKPPPATRPAPPPPPKPLAGQVRPPPPPAPKPAAPARPRARVSAIARDGSRSADFVLTKDETRVGREVEPTEVKLDKDPFIAPLHAVFRFEGPQLVVQDSGTANGVFLWLKERTLESGDELRIGRQRLRVEWMPDEPEQLADQPVWGSPNPGYTARVVQLLEGGGEGDVYPLKPGDNLVGRGSGDVSFPHDGYVSSKHATITVGEGSLAVKDLGSANGTFVRVNGQAAVTAGDLLLVGEQILRIDPA
jgi:pSer/pThr/pTyr-binding forkhead associated (FHA) protein